MVPTFSLNWFYFYIKGDKQQKETSLAGSVPKEKIQQPVANRKSTATPTRKTSQTEEEPNEEEATEEDADYELPQSQKPTTEQSQPGEEVEEEEDSNSRNVRQQKLREDALAKKKTNKVQRRLTLCFHSIYLYFPCVPIIYYCSLEL